MRPNSPKNLLLHHFSTPHYRPQPRHRKIAENAFFSHQSVPARAVFPAPMQTLPGTFFSISKKLPPAAAPKCILVGYLKWWRIQLSTRWRKRNAPPWFRLCFSTFGYSQINQFKPLKTKTKSRQTPEPRRGERFFCATLYTQSWRFFATNMRSFATVAIFLFSLCLAQHAFEEEVRQKEANGSSENRREKGRVIDAKDWSIMVYYTRDFFCSFVAFPNRFVSGE